jgi:hypothetical protein
MAHKKIVIIMKKKRKLLVTVDIKKIKIMKNSHCITTPHTHFGAIPHPYPFATLP